MEMYMIYYNFTNPDALPEEADTTEYDIEESFEGTFSELCERVDYMRKNGCWNISTAYIPDSEYDDSDE